jgi:hypothetical protein
MGETAPMTDPARSGQPGSEPTGEVKVEWLTVAGDPDAWRSIGLTVTADGLIPLVGTSIRIVPAVEGDAIGIVGWVLSGARDTTDIDGLATEVVAPATPVYTDHPLGASGLDHVVVSTVDLERTSGEIALATGCELKRIREVGTMRQGFHRIGRGGLIVELVERPDLPAGPATFWGLVLIVDDLDAAYELLGTDRISAPKDAVQPGRRIATVRAEVGLGLPVALMTH